LPLDPPAHIQNRRLYPPLFLAEDRFPRCLSETWTPVELLTAGSIAEETYAGGRKYEGFTAPSANGLDIL